MNLEFIKTQNLGSLLMKSSQSNFDLRSPSSYLARSYLIATVPQKRKGEEMLLVLSNTNHIKTLLFSFISMFEYSCQQMLLEIYV